MHTGVLKSLYLFVLLLVIMVKNRWYLNKGNFKFEDITEEIGTAKYQG